MDRASIKAIVEVEKGSPNRAVFDADFKMLGYKQVSAAYPFAYGFILNTSSEDGDGIDCYILTNKHLAAGTTVTCVPVGLLEVFENEEVDCKLVCVIENDDFTPDPKHIGQIKDFIQMIFRKYPDIHIQFGEYRDEDYTKDYINERTVG